MLLKSLQITAELVKEFQLVNYDTAVPSTALVFTRFIILERMRRKETQTVL